MKTLCFLAWFVLLVGCEVSETVVQSATGTKMDTQQTGQQSPARAPASWVCENHLDVIGAMDLGGQLLTDDLEITIPKGAHDVAYYLFVLPYSKDGDEMTDEQLVWGVADKTLGEIVSHAWNNNTVEVEVLRDFFDTDGEEPQSVAGVCVQDPCETFEPVVYPRPSCAKFRVIGLINMEGTWRVMSSMFPMAIEVNVYQRGRALTLTQDAKAEQSASLHDNVVTLETDTQRYECILTSRTHCNGTMTDLQTGDTIGTWTADKL